jgi:hypothetical protein
MQLCRTVPVSKRADRVEVRLERGAGVEGAAEPALERGRVERRRVGRLARRDLDEPLATEVRIILVVSRNEMDRSFSLFRTGPFSGPLSSG